MGYKYLIIIVVLAMSVYIAAYIKRLNDNKIEVYEGIIDFLEYIKSQIEYFCTPTEEIIKNYENLILNKYGFLEALEMTNWEKALTQTNMSPYLDNTTVTLLKRFSGTFGKTSSQEQISNCEYTLAQLNNELIKLKQDSPQKTKAYSSLTVISGLMIILLIL